MHVSKSMSDTWNVQKYWQELVLWTLFRGLLKWCQEVRKSGPCMHKSTSYRTQQTANSPCERCFMQWNRDEFLLIVKNTVFRNMNMSLTLTIFSKLFLLLLIFILFCFCFWTNLCLPLQQLHYFEFCSTNLDYISGMHSSLDLMLLTQERWNL